MDKISKTYTQDTPPLLSICVITYNHEEFIEQTIESFLMQEVNFNIEILIHDDASTDKTQAILKKYESNYPGLFKLILQTENQRSKLGGGMQPTFNYPRAKGKYIALCEGDDYWIDPLKLQKQVNFLESNEEYILTHSDTNIYLERLNKVYIGINKTKNRKIKSGNIFIDKLESNYRMFTCTVLFRNNINITTYFKEHKNFSQGDLILYLELAKAGLVKYFDEPLATYRINQGSVTKSQTELKKLHFKQSSLNIRLTIAKKYNVKQSVIDRLKIKHNKVLLELAYLKNDVELMRGTVDLLSDKNVKLNRLQKYKISCVLDTGILPIMKKIILKIIEIKSKVMRKLSNYKNQYTD